MKTINFFAYTVFVLFLGVAISSCKGDDGADGADGIAGADGLDGAAGQDGNANVQTLTYDISAEIGSEIQTPVPEFTQSVLDNDVILWYLKADIIYYAIPGAVDGGNYLARCFAIEGASYVRFVNWDGTNHTIPVGYYDNLKIIIIESTGGKSVGSDNSQQEILTELKNAGVDINDYHDVCDYYGINPE